MKKDYTVIYIILIVVILSSIYVIFSEQIKRFFKKNLLNKNTSIPSNEPILFNEKVIENHDKFIEETKNLGYDLDINPNVLMFFEDYEGLGKFRSYVQNSIGATGFIQILPLTANDLGTTTDYLKSTSNLEYQKVWVRKYFEKVISSRGKLNNWIDVYLGIFYPFAVGKPDSYSLPASVTSQNSQFDLNKNGTITVGEIKNYFQNRVKLIVPQNYWKYFN